MTERRLEGVNSIGEVGGLVGGAYDAGRVQRFATYLHNFRNAGIVTMPEAPVDGLMADLKVAFSEDRTLRLPAEGSVQGTDHGDVYGRELGGVIRKFSKRTGRRGLIIVEGASFSGDVGLGTEAARNQLSEIVKSQNADRRASKREKQPMVLAIGPGDKADLPTTPGYTINKPPFTSLIIARVALESDGTLLNQF